MITKRHNEKTIADLPVDSDRAWGWALGPWASWASPGWARISCRPPWLGWPLASTRSSSSWTCPPAPCLCSRRLSIWRHCYSSRSLEKGLLPGGCARSQGSNGWCGPQDAATWHSVFCMCCHYPGCHLSSTNLLSAAYRCPQIYVPCSCCVCCVCGGLGGGDGGGESCPVGSRLWYHSSWRILPESGILWRASGLSELSGVFARDFHCAAL